MASAWAAISSRILGSVISGSQSKSLASPGGIQDDPRDIEGPGGGIGDDRMRAEAFVAPGGELRQGHGVVAASRDVKDLAGLDGPALVIWRMTIGGEIGGMERVAHLQSACRRSRSSRAAGGGHGHAASS